MTEKSAGKLTLEQLTHAVRDDEIDTVIAAFPDMYGRLVGKRFSAAHFLDQVADHGTHGCDYLLACDMEMDPVDGYQFTSWESGYGDFVLEPDVKTLHRAAWMEKTALVICDVLDENTNEPVEIAPRQMLRCQVERIAELGYVPKGATEVEFFIFKETYDTAGEKHYHDLNTFGRYIEDYHIFQGSKEEGLVGDLRRCLERSGIPVENSKCEWGPGQHELNLCYGEVLPAADHQVIYKQATKDLAYAKELAVTFMAKWDKDQSGNSQHIHLSLWDGDQNVFEGDKELAPGLPIHCSETFLHFVGGQLANCRDLAIFLAPNVNSYKRYRASSFAPTQVAWAIDNRTTAFRVVGHGSSLRAECRIPGADANPYLAIAGLLAAGLDGIQKQTNPPPLYSGDAYQDTSLPQVPTSLIEAIALAEKSEFLRNAFGEEVVEHYLHFARIEQRKFDEAVTDYERARYFERI